MTEVQGRRRGRHWEIETASIILRPPSQREVTTSSCVVLRSRRRPSVPPSKVNVVSPRQLSIRGQRKQILPPIVFNVFLVGRRARALSLSLSRPNHEDTQRAMRRACPGKRFSQRSDFSPILKPVRARHRTHATYTYAYLSTRTYGVTY